MLRSLSRPLLLMSVAGLASGLAGLGCQSGCQSGYKSGEPPPASGGPASGAPAQDAVQGSLQHPGDHQSMTTHGHPGHLGPMTAELAAGAGSHDELHERMPFTECPLTGAEAGEPDRLLHAAANHYDTGGFAQAYACAESAAELVPDSIDAHHLRAMSAAALGHFDVARLAFSLALALDPGDPETLAAAADFYINAVPSRRRETTLLGLAYARSGSSRVVARRRKNQPLRARLALLEAQAFNDLGRSDEALERTEEALALAPESIEAVHERGVALFSLCRFEQARAAFQAVLRAVPDDPYAHHHLGLVHEQLGSEVESDIHLNRARALLPEEFPAPVMVSPEEFRAEVQEAVSELPAELSAPVSQVAIEVADLPALDDLTAVDPPFSPTILGLYRGLPEGVEGLVAGRPAPPRTIVLYRKNLARAVRTRDELDVQIRKTLLHEIGHLRGLDEDDLRRRGLD